MSHSVSIKTEFGKVKYTIFFLRYSKVAISEAVVSIRSENATSIYGTYISFRKMYLSTGVVCTPLTPDPKASLTSVRADTTKLAFYRCGFKLSFACFWSLLLAP